MKHSNRRARPLAELVAMSAALATALACGGSTAPRGAASTPSGGPGAPNVPWSQKTAVQKQDWMGLEVLPKMKALFTEYDASYAQNFECSVCHGDDADTVDFAMPNPGLYALSPMNTLEESAEYDAEVTQFMAKTVVPEMAKLLDMEPYDPESQAGFGCFGCHPAAE